MVALSTRVRTREVLYQLDEGRAGTGGKKRENFGGSPESLSRTGIVGIWHFAFGIKGEMPCSSMCTEMLTCGIMDASKLVEPIIKRVVRESLVSTIPNSHSMGMIFGLWRDCLGHSDCKKCACQFFKTCGNGAKLLLFRAISNGRIGVLFTLVEPFEEKRKESCSLASSGSESPPAQSLSQGASILDRRESVSMVPN